MSGLAWQASCESSHRALIIKKPTTPCQRLSEHLHCKAPQVWKLVDHMAAKNEKRWLFPLILLLRLLDSFLFPPFVTANCWFFSSDDFFYCVLVERTFSFHFFPAISASTSFTRRAKAKLFQMNFSSRLLASTVIGRACLWNANMQIMNNWIVRLWGIEVGGWKDDNLINFSACIVEAFFTIQQSLDECSFFTLERFFSRWSFLIHKYSCIKTRKNGLSSTSLILP